MDLNLTTFHLRLGVLACPLSAPLLAQVKGRGGFQIKKPGCSKISCISGSTSCEGGEVNRLKALFGVQALGPLWKRGFSTPTLENSLDSLGCTVLCNGEGCSAQTTASLPHPRPPAQCGNQNISRNCQMSPRDEVTHSLRVKVCFP